ncbi:DNA-binding response regulator [Pollutimonas sp. M17]|uniref:response regulator transcription factor n=1 Tax=Pollutimonas sp. M17 TaxID=2962065 RepID=UPI0021F4120C|nr:DNA-binding response regulator [Pollutimonas sp. M17]UYO93344.1 DNA-binding response regulator [Pollutimonas sp. M17]
MPLVAPYAEEPIFDTDGLPPPMQDSNPQHILLIDDNPDQLRLLIEVLGNKHYRLTVAMGGAQGYTRAVGNKPDLILLDVRMPNPDGFVVARMLKANPITARVPILFLSAHQGLEERLTGLRLGAVDYIIKPFQPEEVLERVRIHLEIARDLALGLERPTPVAGNSVPRIDMDAQPNVPPSYKTLFAAASRIIMERQDGPIKTSELAAMLSISERRLNVVFEACSGISLFEFVRHERMRKAALLLSQTTLDISYIAAEVGYSRATNFSTEFRKFWGKAPSAFRKHAQ